MIKHGYIYFGIVLLVFGGVIISCKKKIDPPTLSPKTHEGRNTVAYLLEDGKVVGGVLDNPSNAVTLQPNGDLTIYHEDMYYTGNELTMLFSYDSTSALFSFADARYKIKNRLGYLNPSDPGYFIIDYQHDNILAGYFEFNFTEIDSVFYADTLYEVVYTPLMKLKRGRFDVRY